MTNFCDGPHCAEEARYLWGDQGKKYCYPHYSQKQLTWLIAMHPTWHTA